MGLDSCLYDEERFLDLVGLHAYRNSLEPGREPRGSSLVDPALVANPLDEPLSAVNPLLRSS